MIHLFVRENKNIFYLFKAFKKLHIIKIEFYYCVTQTANVIHDFINKLVRLIIKVIVRKAYLFLT